MGNASGSAALLEVAMTLAETDPALTKHVRFGRGIEAYLNLDMVGSTPGH